MPNPRLRLRVRSALFAAFLPPLLLFSACGEDNVSAPATGTVRVTTVTTGDMIDADGYTVSVGDASEAIATDGTVEFSEVPVGEVTVSLSGLAGNCPVDGENPVTVTVVGDGTVEHTFAVACVAITGSVEVTVIADGCGDDPDGFVATVNGVDQAVSSGGTVTFADVPIGERSVALGALATNCAVDGASERLVAVTEGATATVTFDVVCEGPQVYVDQWGSPGSATGQFQSLSGLAVDVAGDVYVTELANDRVQVFDETGGFLRTWGSAGTADGEFDDPFDVAVDGVGGVFVTEEGGHRVQKFDPDGFFQTKWGTFGAGNGQFDQPRGIAVDASGNVFVTDAGNDRLQKFDSDGLFKTKWGTTGSAGGEFSDPSGIAVDPAGDVYVADTGNDRIQVFTGEGLFEAVWGTTGTGPGEFDRPVDVVVDAEGHVFVLDAGNDRIQVFDRAGNWLAEWGETGLGDGQFVDPTGLGIDADGEVHVGDSGNDRIQTFRCP
jgi:streptogramin lyase